MRRERMERRRREEGEEKIVRYVLERLAVVFSMNSISATPRLWLS